MGVPVINTGAMTVDEFYRYADARPEHRKLELIRGKPALNAAAASLLHQRIVGNIYFAMRNRVDPASWEVLTDYGVRVSENNRPEPDVSVVPRLRCGSPAAQRDSGDTVVAFEVLSPSTEKLDLTTKREAYTSLPSLTHYVVIAQDAVGVIVFARDNRFRRHRLTSLEDVVELRSVGVSLSLAEIYQDTGV